MVCSTLTNDTLTTTYANINSVTSDRACVTNFSATYCDLMNCCVLDLNFVTLTNVSLMYYYNNVSAMNACMFIADMENASINNLLFKNSNGS